MSDHNGTPQKPGEDFAADITKANISVTQGELAQHLTRMLRVIITQSEWTLALIAGNTDLAAEKVKAYQDHVSESADAILAMLAAEEGVDDGR